jgi:hypothetical protein
LPVASLLWHRVGGELFPTPQMQPTTPTTSTCGMQIGVRIASKLLFQAWYIQFYLSLALRVCPRRQFPDAHAREPHSSFWHSLSMAPIQGPMTWRHQCVSKTELIPDCNWIAPITLMQALSPANLLRAINDNTSLISARRHQSPSKMIKKQFPLFALHAALTSCSEKGWNMKCVQHYQLCYKRSSTHSDMWTVLIFATVLKSC